MYIYVSLLSPFKLNLKTSISQRTYSLYPKCLLIAIRKNGWTICNEKQLKLR